MASLFSDSDRTYERHVVLVAPEVHWNTGNIGRTCLGTGTSLHLVKPLGFSLDSREVKRAGLDYWHKVGLFVWESFDDFLVGAAPGDDEIAVFSKNGKQPFWEMPLKQRLFLVFGSETKGLPASVFSRYQDMGFHIPTTTDIRCLNLSTSVGIALYESIRGCNPRHGYRMC